MALAMVPDGQGEEPILTLIDPGGQHRITIVAGAVFRALQLALGVAEQCESAALFVSDENLAALKQWGEDHRNPLRFTVRRYVTGIELALSDRNKIVIKAKWPEPPDLGPLRRIVDAGIRLKKLRR